MSKCWNCYYYGRNTFTCDFYLITGARRGCPANACTRYTPRGKLRKQTLVVLKGSHKVDNPRYRQLESLYRQGLNDAQIAELTGLCRNTVLKWRKGNGLPANTHGGRPSHD